MITGWGRSSMRCLPRNLNRVFGAIALNALEVYALSTPWLHQDTTTITLYGAYEEEARPGEGPVPPRPAYGHSKDGHDDLKQVLLSLGVSSEGLPLRMGLRDGNTSDSTETPVAIEECLALGLDGVRGIVADSKAYCKRTLGLCLEQGVGLITLVPRTCAVRQEVEAWGQQHGALPLLLEKPGRTRQEPPRRWHGQSVVRRVPVEYADGRLDVAEIRFLVVHSSQLAHQAAVAYAAAQAKEAERVAEHIQRVEARWFACAADAEAAIAEYEGRGQGRRGRKPRPWRYHVLHYRVEAVSVPKNGRVEAVRRRPRHPRSRSAIASSCTQRPWSPPRTRTGGPSWPPRCGQRSVRMPRCSRRIRNNISRWNRAFAGSRIPPPSARCGWRNPNGLRRWPCSRSWGCWCMP